MPAEPYIGQIMPFAGTFAPLGWALCNGQLLPINQNQALFSILTGIDLRRRWAHDFCAVRTKMMGSVAPAA